MCRVKRTQQAKCCTFLHSLSFLGEAGAQLPGSICARTFLPDDHGGRRRGGVDGRCKNESELEEEKKMHPILTLAPACLPAYCCPARQTAQDPTVLTC
ncbi:hypothetical protein LZ31DRAFT_558637 [Colletotrichum somersetense]|nr:hypothetical protein LZ31DRAFT_558637 [Colletotrichum somersetense]